MNLFDLCVITASSPKQAETFKALIDRRIRHGLYPHEIEFKVYADPQAGRVGSGGGTLLALSRLHSEASSHDAYDFFSNKKIAMIHAGGESRRLPCYAPEGKLFAPIPVESSSIIPPVILDVQLGLFLKYPWNQGEVLISSGDAVIDFDSATVPHNRGSVCGFAKPASFEQGSRHGVFKFDRNRETVVDFFQKKRPEFLAKHAALDGTDECALDMGLVSLDAGAAAAFCSFGGERLGVSTVRQLLTSGKMNFDLYLEVMTACLGGIDFARFADKTGNASKLGTVALRALFKAFCGFTLRGVVTRSTAFIHFGSLSEYPASCREIQRREILPFYHREGEEIKPLVTETAVAYNSMEDGVSAAAETMKTVFVENVNKCSVDDFGGENLLLGLRSFSCPLSIPRGICIDRRVIDKKALHLVYGIHDTFKSQHDARAVIYCGMQFDKWLAGHGLKETDVWQKGEVRDLLRARLFIPGAEAAYCAGYWSASADKRWTQTFLKSARISIIEANVRTNALAREKERIDIRKKILAELVGRGKGWYNISMADFCEVFKVKDAPALRARLTATDDPLLRLYRETLFHGIASSNAVGVSTVLPEVDYVGDSVRLPRLTHSVKEDQIVWARSSVRFDLAGGWSDTPPYTLRSGGRVVNCAVDLNGQPPIQIFVRPMKDFVIRMHSIDLGVTETLSSFKQLADYRSPISPFALPRAALCMLGLTRENHRGKTLIQCLHELSCGIEITTLCAIPKGSGLGTSSVLGGTILAALQRFFGRVFSLDDLFRQVLQMEQMLTTGGGWQDQIGGLSGGVKYVESRPGLKPAPILYQLDPSLFIEPESHACFTLFYTGITRLAKNILQDVVTNSNGMTPAFLFTLQRVGMLAEEAKEAISLRRKDLLAKVLNGSWLANKLIHPSTSNRELERLLRATKPYYSGVKLNGAGGGGYALFLSRDGDTADMLRETIVKKFENGKARLVDFSLNPVGLQVSVS
jgi:galactokinase/mevalonate kinase-like predicted kinase